MRVAGRSLKLLAAMAALAAYACTSPVAINGKYAEPLGTAGHPH